MVYKRDWESKRTGDGLRALRRASKALSSDEGPSLLLSSISRPGARFV